MNGAQGRNRTTDTAIFSRMLYQLSYLGVHPRRGARRVGAGCIGAAIAPVQHPRAAPACHARPSSAEDSSAGRSSCSSAGTA